MIDLHIHTKYSDGTDSVKEILLNANKLKLKTISITDHNSCDAYEEMEMLNISQLYDGDIIVGCEFTTSFDDRLIEILGYGFDFKVIKNYLDRKYNENFEKNKRISLGEKLISILVSNGFKMDINNCVSNYKSYNFYSIRKIYDEIVKYDENIIKDSEIFSSYEFFLRKGIYNTKSKYYLNYTRYYLKVDEIIELIHNAGGLVFLAHPFQYKFDDIEDFLNKIYDENKLDGIECFYTTFTEQQSNYLLDFARERKLLISGGSDYHGGNKEQHNLGIGSGNLNISNDIIINWNIEYYNNNKSDD